MSLDYESDSLLIDSLASSLVKKSASGGGMIKYGGHLSGIQLQVRHKIENVARSYPAPTEELQKGLSKFVFGRMQELYNQLSGFGWEVITCEMLEHFHKPRNKKHGVIERSN